MNHYLKFILVLSITLLNTSRAEIVHEINIIGNHKTNKQSILKAAGLDPKNIQQDIDLTNFIHKLNNIPQIKILNIQLKEKILTIEIEEKWTFYPIPYFSSSGANHEFGFYLYDDNFLGTLGTMSEGVTYSRNKINSAVFYFQNETFFSEKFGFKFLLSQKNETITFARSDKVIYQSELDSKNIIFAPNLLINDHVIKAGPILSQFKQTHLRQSDFDSIKLYGLFIRHHLNAYNDLSVSFKGIVTTLDLYELINSSKKIKQRIEGNIISSYPYKNHFFNIGVHGHYSSEPNIYMGKNLGGEEGFRGYDKNSLPSSQNLGSLLQFQFCLLETLYLTGFHEFNKSSIIQPIRSNSKINDHTIGSGLRYYFKKISIPAASFEYAKNISDKTDHFQFNIGFSY